MQHIITKFGGTSVSSRKSWDNIVTIVKDHIANNKQPVIVCSALSQATNTLDKLIDAAIFNDYQGLFQELKNNYLNLTQELDVSASIIDQCFNELQQWLTGISLLKEAPDKTRAQIFSMGELMLTHIGHQFLENQGISCTWFDARDALTSKPTAPEMPTEYLNASCEDKFNKELKDHFLNSKSQAVITQGFIAASIDNDTVLLGRGGSDTSAALFSTLLNAEGCEIWTDVPGVYTANPHQLPHARLLKQLDYDETQEIASMGAKVLHPNCLPPLRRANIPLYVKYTQMPQHSGTKVSKESDESAPPIKSILVKHSVTLISIDTLSMWQQVGFLADIFAVFKKHGFSVDLISTSEFNVTISLDSIKKTHPREALEKLIAELNTFSRAKIIEPCSAVSMVGHHIRTVLPQLTPSLEVFDSKQIYMMSLASNDLNLTFVVDESQANKLCQKLHNLLIESNPQSFYYSKSWHEEFGDSPKRAKPWWEEKRNELLDIAKDKSPCYVYNLKTLKRKISELQNLSAIDKLFYAVKANPHTDVLRTLYDNDINFDCVSIEEIQHILTLFPNIDKKRILFTPNFAAKAEYKSALDIGCYITIDSTYPLEHWPELFKNKEIVLRIDPGCGAGHHKYVCTGGNESKFGIPRENIEKANKLINKHHIKVIGLHAHSGSGILSPDLWQETAMMLASLIERFPTVEFVNLGGGLGVVDKPNQQALDIKALDESLIAVKTRYPHLDFWLEPGRFYVSECGVILAKVTQRKEKEKVRFIGIETGMNSLMRPMLYGAYHEIVNLSKLHDEKINFAHIVGPICESGDTLGYDRLLPETLENDVLLIANTGAYGHCMSSSYNLRPPAQEIIIE